MFTKEIVIRSQRRNQFIDVTSEVLEAIKEAGVKEGICLLYVPHTTAGVTINENADPSVQQDILNKLEELVPKEGRYLHLEGNADAHIKASLIGSFVTIPLSHGRPLLGTWQGIFFCEFDGPRQRRMIVRIM